jgi:hypothetical protein
MLRRPRTGRIVPIGILPLNLLMLPIVLLWLLGKVPVHQGWDEVLAPLQHGAGDSQQSLLGRLCLRSMRLLGRLCLRSMSL